MKNPNPYYQYSFMEKRPQRRYKTILHKKTKEARETQERIFQKNHEKRSPIQALLLPTKGFPENTKITQQKKEREKRVRKAYL
jgi:vacuolar-type H+-ATPase subunit H